MSVIGYEIMGQSELGTYFFENVPDGIVCPECGTCIDYSYAPTNMRIHQSRKYDIANTYDGRSLVSKRFVDYCLNELRVEEVFRSVTKDERYHYYLPKRVVPFDAARRKTRFERPCRACGGYGDITGANPVFLKISALPGVGFFRTDLAFASNQEKFPSIIVDSETKARLESQHFRGLVTFEVYSCDHEDPKWPVPS